ncbi:LLM class flavin-dependent oxidoreductase [Nonomuraea sp. NPDC003804]|uniref:LLM class flavin-dependent oxidoreductase n=1 Tax=Nonomuraea sp. NPDC003804 TaxID=3154547 RepID=UPI0033B9D751
MRFGLKVNPGTWQEAGLWARIAEESGFHSLWTGDNLLNSRDAATPVHDGPTIIAAWAATTTRIRVGLLIANMAYRRPTVLAKQAVSIDHVAAGRFELGIGSGLWPADHAMAGVPFWNPGERAERLREFVGVVDRLLSGDTRDHEGPHYPYSGAAMSPAPVQPRIPLIVAANGPKGLAVVADHADAWVTFTGASAEEQFHEASVKRSRTLDRLCGERGRQPGEVRRILLAYGSLTPWASADAFARMVERYQAIGFDEIVCYAPKPEERAVFDKVVSRFA